MLAALDNARVVALERQFSVEPGASVATIQAAIDAGKRVRFGAGTWSLGTTGLTINGPADIEGEGEGVTILTYTGTGSAITVNSTGVLETLKVGLRHLTLDGTNATTGGAYGITLGNLTGTFKTGSGLFVGVTTKRFKTAGVRCLVGAMGTWLRCTFELNRDGWWSTTDFTNGCTTQTFLGCRFVSNVKRGLFLEQADSVVVSNNCQIEDNGEEGALVRHPGGATLVMRNVTFDTSYFEDNSTAGAFSDLRWDNVSTQSIQNGAVRRCRLQGANADGNIWWGKISGGIEEDNEFSPVAITNNIALSSVVCFVHSRNYRTPATIWTLGANAVTTHERRAGNGTMAWYVNSSGTAQLVLDMGTANKLGFFGTAAAAKPAITGSRGGNAALADLLTKLAALGLITDSSSA